MQQYHTLLNAILIRGTDKPAARKGMPGSRSLFGYQFRHDLKLGFPLLTTKKMFWKGIVVELLWFLRGDTNIKYLVDNGVNFWNQDAYNYYLKLCKENNYEIEYSFGEFVSEIKNCVRVKKFIAFSERNPNYTLGDCGYQYGRVWRNWDGIATLVDKEDVIARLKKQSPRLIKDISIQTVDQIKNVYFSLKHTPEGRRHIVTAIDPAHDKDLALYWCHAMFQFNCRPISFIDRAILWEDASGLVMPPDAQTHEFLDEAGIPKYYLDCHLYQRSADVVLGVPFNIASYALLTHIMARAVGMIPGEYIHTFGDVHIYENHMAAVHEQLRRDPLPLPKLMINREPFDELKEEDISFDNFINKLDYPDFLLQNYKSLGPLESETKLSTGTV